MPTLEAELFDGSAAASVDASAPELLVFAPGPDGTERLVALEYLTIKASWDAQHGGVAQVSRKGETPAEAGPDFSGSDVRKAQEIFEAVAPHLTHARPERF